MPFLLTGAMFALASLLCAQTPIPDTMALLKEVQAQQHKMDEVRENYTFHRTRLVDDVDQNGAVIKTSMQEREIFFVNGHQIARLVKREGVELSAAEQKSEDARVMKLTERFIKTPASRTGLAGMVSQILAVAQVSSPRRLPLKGRDTLAFDFTGDPSAHAHGTVQNAGKKLTGTIWIDEADRQVARLEFTVAENFHIGGGLLASVQKGSTITVEQSPVGQGLWLETGNEQHVSARLLVVKSFRQNVQVKDFDFKRFDVGTVQR